METSTHFGLNLVTGSDKVNPLTIDRPNYEKIDEQMYKNQAASILEATELKSGKVHAITCLTENAVFFRFTATSDYETGDTFTFNGAPVSGVLPNGAGLQSGVFKINSTVLCSIIGTLLTVYSVITSEKAADSERLGGQEPSYYAKATDAIGIYTHSRIGTVNNFVGTGANGKVKFVSNIQPGDTIQVNGQTVTAYAGASDFIDSVKELDLVGKTVYFVYDNTSSVVTFAISRDVQSYSPPAYSTIPVDTGKKWIDGKTIWQTVVSFTSSNVKVQKNIPVGDTVERFISVQAVVETATTGAYGVAPTIDTQGTTIFGISTAYSNSSANNANTVGIIATTNAYANRPGYMVVEYTRP